MSDTTVEWDDDALTKLENVPVFVRKMVKGKIEKAAIAKGETKITAELMDIIKSEEM
ncbi:MAG: protochlorophyllide oxidoreductase [Deltaproteobacteria bacterium]|nr:protochlorophyllide oxidoreductase [Deltaproteobacteria bacterium]